MLLLNTHLCSLAVVFFPHLSIHSLIFLMTTVSDLISQLIKGLQCSQLQPLGIIVRTSFHHVCFTLLQFDKGSEFLAAQRVYLFWLCYSYVTAVCLLKYLCMQTFFAARYAGGHTYTFVPAYMLLGNKRTTYSSCISSPCNVLKWRDTV